MEVRHSMSSSSAHVVASALLGIPSCNIHGKLIWRAHNMRVASLWVPCSTCCSCQLVDSVGA